MLSVGILLIGKMSQLVQADMGWMPKYIKPDHTCNQQNSRPVSKSSD